MATDPSRDFGVRRACASVGLLLAIVPCTSPGLRAEDPPPFLTLFGRPVGALDHAEPAELWTPMDVDADSEGNLWVVDQDYHRVVKFSRHGTYLGAFGSQGSADGQFEQPVAIAVGPGDEIFVLDHQLHRVQVFDATGNYLRQFGSAGGNPGQIRLSFGIDVDDATGTVYVADSSGRFVHAFDVSGAFLRRWTWKDPVGDVAFAPQNVVVEASGNVLVLDWYAPYAGHFAVNRFTPGGALLSQWGPYANPPGDGEFSNPWGGAVDAAGNVFVSDYYGQSVQKFTADGTFLWRTDETRREGYSTLFFPTGLWFGEGVLTTLEYTSDGQTVQQWGEAPHSLAVDVPTLAEGDLLTLRSFAGVPNQLALLFVIGLNGAPFTDLVARGRFDADGHWTFEVTVPSDPALPGLTLDLMDFTLDEFGKVVASEPVQLRFE